ncbi:glycine-rich domain-containing protein [Streptomyces minutiscleroticus]|uniref:glycine-rich domain-containing protein n=1 Tax=Streptomyces minutiscleroticus TaxID=68238 RepID=UPI00331B0376
MTVNTAIAGSRTGRSLVDHELFDRLVSFLEYEEKVPRVRAEKVVDQALAFLWMSGHRADVPLSPSRQVDPGWHVFLLHSREYARWCQEQFGRFLHHNPFKGQRLRDGVAVRRTVDAIEAAGFAVDRDLWGVAAECNAPTCCGDGPCC